MWEKNKRTTKCEKRTVTCDVGTIQSEDEIVKCEKKVTWCSRLPTSGYRTPLFLGEYCRIIHERKEILKSIIGSYNSSISTLA